MSSLSLLLITVALAILRGRFGFDGMALLLLIAAAVASGASLMAPECGAGKCFGVAMLTVSLLLSLGRLPMIEMIWQDWRVTAKAPAYFITILAWLLLVLALIFDRRAKLARCLFIPLLISHAVVASWFLQQKPGEKIDVYVIQKLGAQALLDGKNPFAITFPDIYGPNAHFYPPGVVAEHVVQTPLGLALVREVQCGYFYLPMSLLLAVPGYLAGDVRYVNLVCLSLAAALIGYSRSTRLSFLCGALVLLMPGVFFILVNAWIEPQMLMLLAAAVFFAIRGYRTVSYIALGLLLAEKQYMILAAPVFLLLVPETGARQILRAGAIVVITAGVVILPFFFWNPHAFLHSTTALYVNLIRTDSISIPAWLKLKFKIQLHLLVTAGVGAAAAIVTACRGRRDPATFAAGMAFVLTVTFLFSTQAFINYYFFAAGALCLSLAVQEAPALGNRVEVL